MISLPVPLTFCLVQRKPLRDVEGMIGRRMGTYILDSFRWTSTYCTYHFSLWDAFFFLSSPSALYICLFRIRIIRKRLSRGSASCGTWQLTSVGFFFILKKRVKKSRGSTFSNSCFYFYFYILCLFSFQQLFFSLSLGFMFFIFYFFHKAWVLKKNMILRDSVAYQSSQSPVLANEACLTQRSIKPFKRTRLRFPNAKT